MNQIQIRRFSSKKPYRVQTKPGESGELGEMDLFEKHH